MTAAESWQPPSFTSDDEPAEWRGDPEDLFVALDTLLELLQRPAWHARAACRGAGPDAWYPTHGQSPWPGKAVCATCEVREDCLAEAVATPGTEDFGIWGGTSQRERRLLRRRSPSVEVGEPEQVRS